MYQIFPPFRLQPPVVASESWSGFNPELTARSADRIPFGDHSVTWASPLASRLATTTGRIEFVIPTDWSFTSSCFPPLLAETQLPSVTEFKPNSDGDFHPADSTRSQAH